MKIFCDSRLTQRKKKDARMKCMTEISYEWEFACVHMRECIIVEVFYAFNEL